MTEAAPLNFALSDYVPNRCDLHIREFIHLLTGENPGVPEDETEKTQMEVAKKIIPHADDVMALIFARLISKFVLDPAALLAVAVPHHYEVMSSYAWAVSPNELDRLRDVENGYGEGVSIHWLSVARNTALDQQEAMFRSHLGTAFFNNRWQSLAVRAWLRLQAMRMDMQEVEGIKQIWSARWPLVELGASPDINYSPALSINMQQEAAKKLT